MRTAHAGPVEPGSFLRKFARLRAVALLGVVQMAVLPIASVGVQAQTAPAANTIIPDGRTQTQVTTSGTVTDITTRTVSGTAGFNTFSQFRGAAANTVNLHVPNGASSLVNIVRDGPVVIDGVLNAYKDGKIGGNVYFSDSAGFVVGRQGVINVGSLTVNTPKREFLDTVVDRDGRVNAAAAGQLMNGDIPISKDGMIAIRGRINTVDGGVKLQGQTVVVAGPSSDKEFATKHHQRMFDASVNTRGMKRGGTIVARGGSIQILAAGDARIGGTLRTVATRSKPAGKVTIAAGNDIKIGAKAKIEAKGYNGKDTTLAGSAVNAGDITLKAGNKLTVKDGATFNASSARGNAGTVELSGAKKLDIGNLNLDLHGANGTGGTLLIDPNAIVIGDASLDASAAAICAAASDCSFMSNATVASMMAALVGSGGRTFILRADNAITVEAHGVIDARRLVAGYTSADAYDVKLEAPNLTIADGGKILAQAVNRTDANPTFYTDGNVTLLATASDTKVAGSASASTEINIAGTITGKNIDISASSTAISNFNSTTVGNLAFFAQTLGGSVLGLNGGQVSASATARINVAATANINGSGNVTMRASGVEDAEDPVIASSLTALLGLGSPLAASVVVGQIHADIAINIASDATVSAGGKLDIKATNDATAAVSALGVSSTAQFNANVAYLSVDVNTSASVASGAHISSGTNNNLAGGVSVVAANTNNFSVSATSVSISQVLNGSIGAAVAYSTINTAATASFGADLGTDASHLMRGGLTVDASSVTTKNATSSSTVVGPNGLIGLLISAIDATAVDTFVTQLMSSKFSASFPLSVAGALSLTDSTQTANASIGASAGGRAPGIYVGGDVAVVSKLIDDGIHTNASASANSKDPTKGDAYAISAAVAYGSYTHGSNATIGQGVTVNADHIGVAATTELPATNTWLVGDSFGTVLSHINGNLGIVNNILTSYANSTADSGNSGTLALAGAMSYFLVDNSTNAWVSSGATLNARGSGVMASTALGTSSPSTHDWTGALNVTAAASVSSIDIAGNAGAAGIFNGTGGGGSSVGGAASVVSINNTTIAGIGDHATVATPGQLSVAATVSNFLFELAPTSGISKGALTLNGVTSIGMINDVTYASISNNARVSTAALSLLASENISQFSTSGAIAIGGGSGVGLSVAYLSAVADTKAYVGDNRADGTATGADLNVGQVSGGYIHADTVLVSATTAGRLTSAAVAAVESDPSTASSGLLSKLSAISEALDVSVFSVMQDAKAATDRASGASPGSFSLDIAGSSALAFVSLDTNAHITGASISRYTSTNTTDTITVRATNNTLIDVGSGAAAFNLNANSSSGSAAIAGAISVLVSGNATKAYIDSATIDEFKSVIVQALSGGAETSIGIGLSVGATSNAASLSGSVGIISDSANAYISNSSISGSSATSGRGVDVTAYKTTDVGIGGGSLYLSGGKGGLGLSVTYASIHNPDGRNAVDAHVTDTSISHFDTLNVSATDASRIAAGAAAGGGGPDANGLAGAIVINLVSTTTTAYIGGSRPAVSIDLTGAVTVTVDSLSLATLDATLRAVFSAINGGHDPADASGIDFSGAALGSSINVGGAAIIAVAGLVQAGKNNVGLALVSNAISTTHSALISDVHITAGTVIVSANDNSAIMGVTVGFGLATGQFAGLASTTLSSIENTVLARIGDSTPSVLTSVTATGDISIVVTDSSVISGSAGALAASFGAAALGLSVVQSSISNNITATAVNATLRAGNDVGILAASTGTISAVAVGIAVSRNVGLAGSVVDSAVNTDVTASAMKADIIAQNNVGIGAGNSDAITVVAGAAGVTIASPSIAGGLSLVTSAIGGDTQALIGDGSKVDAYAGGTGLMTIGTGDLVTPFDPSAQNGMTTSTPSLAETTRTVHGLAVTATSKQAVVANAVSAGLAIFPVSGAFAVVPVTNTMSGLTKASIDQSQIDTRMTGPDTAQVVVNASSHSYAANYIIALAGGGVAGSAANSTNQLDRKTIAAVTDSTAGSGTGGGIGRFEVKASATQAAADVVIGVAAGIGSGAASGILNTFAADTEAYVDRGSITAQQLDVKAKSANAFLAAAGSGAAGAVGLASSYVVASSNNTTLAYIGDTGAQTVINLSGNLTVAAQSDNAFHSLASGGAAAGGVGIAGMVNVIALGNTTRAGLYDVQAALGSGAVSVTAVENVNVGATTGAGATGSLGIGAATNVVILGSQVAAEMVDSTVTTAGAVTVSATSNKSIDSQTMTVAAGGTVGIGASIGVILLGASAPDGAGSELNANGSGTLSAVDATSATSTTAITLSAAGIAAYRAVIGAGATGQTDAQIQSSAQAAYSALLQNGNVDSSGRLVLGNAGLGLYATPALGATDAARFSTLASNGTLGNGTLTLTADGLTAYRATATSALGGQPTDAQIQAYANQQYQGLATAIRTYANNQYQNFKAGSVGFVLDQTGIAAYRAQAVSGLNLSCAAGAQCGADTDVIRYANSQFQALSSNGTFTNGSLTGLSATGLNTFRAAALADLNARAAATATASGSTAPTPATAVTDAQIVAYANSQYQFLAGHRNTATMQRSFSVSSAISNVSDGVSSAISGGSVNASSVGVTATANVSTNNYSTGIAATGVGVGAALAYTRIDTSIAATISQATVHAGSVTVAATANDGADGPAAKIKSVAGAGGMFAAAGAAVADAQIHNAVTAALGGNITVSGAANVSADDHSGIRADAFGATVGGGLAIGISLAKANRTSIVDARVLAASQVAASGLTVRAGSDGISWAGAIAGTGGLAAAGVGAEADAYDTTSVSARVGAGSAVNVGGGSVLVQATEKADVKALSLGVAVAGGLGVGVSIAKANAAPTVLAQLDGSDNASAPHTVITSGSLTVKATSDVNGTPATSVPTSASTPSSTDDFTAGGTNAASWAVAGSGAVYYAATGTVSSATNTSDVTSAVGNYVQLPGGIVSVEAINTSAQVAYGTGVVYGGVLAIGVVQANANAFANTRAQLGNYVTMLAAGTGSLSVKATGKDNNTARAISGGGGMVAGNGATANTDNDSTVAVTLGNNVQANVDSIVLAARHDANFGMYVDSAQAAVLGASGSVTGTEIDTAVRVSVGNGSSLAATGSLTRNCYTALCLQAISITAVNNFFQFAGNSISAGAGGGINGAGAVSSTTLNGSTDISTGSGVTLSGGTDNVNKPGTFSIVASSDVQTNDTVSLTTGGAIQGAGVDSTTYAQIDNNITIGTGNILLSKGSIGIGTYTRGNVKNNAYVTTYGIAAVGVASATSEFQTNQTVTISSGTTILAFSNVNIAAAQDPFGSYFTDIYSNAVAQGYVRGIIAVPDADATANAVNHATLTIAGAIGTPNTTGYLAPAFVGAGQNIYIGAYDGRVNRDADGTGHGYVLGFIPVTNGNDHGVGIATSVLNMNGTVVAGVYHQQTVIIGCGSDGTTMCGAYDTPTLFSPSGVPLSFLYSDTFDAVSYVNSVFGAGSDAATALINGGVLAGPYSKAFVLTSQLYASGGSVTINADTIHSSGGSVTAYGSANISVINNSVAYLLVAGGALIPVGGGDITFTGAAVGATAIQRTIVESGLPSISINNAYNGQLPTGYTQADGQFVRLDPIGPGMFVGGPLTNLSGSILIANALGSYGATADVNALQFTVNVPNGAFAVGGGGVAGFYAGGSPIAEWYSFVLLPGITNGLNANNAIDAIAKFQYGAGGNADVMNDNLYSHPGDPRGYSIVLYGNCLPRNSGSCGGAYEFGPADFPRLADFGSLTKVSYSYSDANIQPASPHIYGGQVAIKADIIDINGIINAGLPTSWSLNLSSSVAGLVAQYQAQYQAAVQSNPNANAIYTLVAADGTINVAGVTVNASGDRAIPLQYNAATQQFIVGRVNASSGGGLVVLDGKIMSTNTLGSIHVQGGFGQVTLNNETSVAIVANDINTGTASAASMITSTVRIVDRNSLELNNTSTYVYSNGQIKLYKTINGAAFTDSTPYTITNGNATSYRPVTGTRFEWMQEALLQRTIGVANGALSVSEWQFSGNQNNPYSYSVLSSMNAAPDEPMAYYGATSSTPQGHVIVNASDTSVFRETISGHLLQSNSYGIYYTGCNGSTCHYGFTQTSVGTGSDGKPEGHGDWTYIFPTTAFVRVVSSVKADNPFGISFDNNNTAFLNITSNASVTLNGSITNPSGTTTIRTNNGDVLQSSTGSIQSGNLNITSAGAIGTANNPLNLSLSAGATMTTQANGGGTYVKATSPVAIKSVTATGDVAIAAAGSILAAAGSTGIAGRNITLSSTTGSVGSIANPLKLTARPDNPVNGVVNNGVVNVTANGDIGIDAAPPAGKDFRVGSIISIGGDILINIASGSIVNSRSQTAAQALSAEQIATIAATLHLTNADGAAAAGQATVATFEKKITNDYAAYNSLIQNGSYNATTGLFVLNAGAEALYASFAAAAGKTLSAYVTALYQGYAADFSLAFGANWATLPQFNGQYQTYQALLNNGSVVASSGNFVLRDSGVSLYAGAALSGTDATAFNALLAGGTVAGGTLTLNGQGLASYATAALDTANSAALAALNSNGTVQNGALVLSNAGMVHYAAAALNTGAAATFSSLLANGTVTDGVLTLSTTGLAAYAAQANLSPTLTSGQVQQMANAQYQSLATQIRAYANDQYGTLTTQVQAYANTQYQGLAATVQAYANTTYASAKATFTFSASSAQAAPGLVATLTANSVWTAGQLVAAIDRSALQPAAPAVGNGLANIAGRNVTITTQSGSLGNTAADVMVALTAAANAAHNLQDGTITESQLAALAAATTPGTVVLNGVNAQGQVVSGLDLSNLPAGVTLTNVGVSQLAPLYINVTGNLRVTSSNAVYVQSTTASAPSAPSLPSSGGMLHIDRVTANGDINIQAQQGIVAALGSNGAPLSATQIMSTLGNLTLASASGNIGSDTAALTYDVGGKLVYAGTGGGSIYLNARGTDVQIGRIFATNTVSFTANGNLSGYLPGAAISANNLILNIAGDVGSTSVALGLEVGGGFVISQSAIATYRAQAAACAFCVSDAQVMAYAHSQFDLLTRIDNGIVSGGQLTLSDVGIAAFRAAAQAAANAAAPAGTTAAVVTVAEIQAYANAQYQFLVAHREQSGLSGNIAGSGYFYAPQLSAATAPALQVAQLTAAHDLSVRADGLLEIETGLTATNGKLTVLAGSLLMGANATMTAGGPISIASLGEAVLGQVKTTYGAQPGDTSPAINVTAAGMILSNGDGRATFLATAGAVSLTAGTGIGNLVNPLVFDARRISATALSGNIGLAALHDAEATLLSAVKGNVGISGAGNLTLDSVLAGTVSGAVGGTLLATAAHGQLTIGTATTGGKQTLKADGDISFTSLTTTGVTANGVVADIGDVEITSDHGKIAGGAIAANGSATLTAATAIQVSSLTTSTGAISLQAPGLIDWTTLNAATTILATSTGAGINFGTATSGGTQTLRADGDIAFTALTTTGVSANGVVTDIGDVEITSDHGKIAGGTIAANGSATLAAATTIQGSSLTTTTGAISLQAPGLIDWTTLNAATTIHATSTGAGVNFGTATSGGKQAIRADGDIAFATLTTTGTIANGVVADIGDVEITSEHGKIAGGAIAANGSTTLAAATTIQGSSVTTTTGAISLLAPGLIDWTTLNAATTIQATSTGAGINFGTATSGGKQTIKADGDVAFAMLTTTGTVANGMLADIGDVEITSEHGKIAGGTIAANGSATLAAATTIRGSSVTTTTGAISLQAPGLIDWTTLNAATTLRATSTSAGVNFGTATSGGTQTLQADGDVAFAALTTHGVTSGVVVSDIGDVLVTSDRGKIGGGTIDAHGSAILSAATTLQGLSLTTGTGAASLRAVGDIDWTTLQVGTTLTALSTGAGIRFGTAQSGGALVLHAANDVAFGSLAATGTNGGSGDVTVTADTGNIAGTSIAADGAARLTARGAIMGQELASADGAIVMQAGRAINWTRLTAGTTLTAVSSGAGIAFGTATSAQAMWLSAANDIAFNQLSATGNGGRGDISVQSQSGRLVGGSIAANDNLDMFGNGVSFADISAGRDINVRSTADLTGHRAAAIGNLTLAAGVAPGTTGTLAVDVLEGATTTLSSTGAVKLGNVNVSTGLTLSGGEIEATITQTGGSGAAPLAMDITGANGGVANAVALRLNAQSVQFVRLSAVNASILSSGRNLAIANGYVSGRMAIATTDQVVLMNNRSAAPTGDVNVQLFQPGNAFNLSLQGYALSTNSFVVEYKAGSQITDYLGGVAYEGVSLVREFARNDRMGQGLGFQAVNDGARSTLFVTGTNPNSYLDIQAPKKDIESTVSGAAVNVGQ